MTEKLTTVGAIRIKHSMPTQEAKDAYDLYRPLDKNGVKKVVVDLLEKGGPAAFDHINNLGKLFFNTATEIGASTPLSDYINDSDERQALIKEFDSKAQSIMNSTASKPEKNRLLAEVTGQYNKKIEAQNLHYLVSKGSMAAKMARTGARGNPSQLASGTASPLMSMNVKSEMVPVVIKHGFAEGMTPAEHLALSYMGRGSTVMSQLSTALPGALFKKLSPTVFHEVVTIPDCGTKNGIAVPTSDKKSLIGRYTSDTATLVTEPYLRDAIASGKKQLLVRSAMTCEAHDGVCQKCFGLMASGKIPEIGTNVGVIAAQSVSEKLTQSMLSTKHKATVGERKGNAYEQAANILNNPADNFKDEATISTVNGEVQGIHKTSLGDSEVIVNGAKHFVPIGQQVVVQPGDSVKMGQRLSTGTVNPRKLVALRGLGAGRDYMAKELRDIYGSGLDPRHFEIISKNMMKYVEVIDPGHTGLLPGDKVDVNAVRKYLDKGQKVVPLHLAEGSILAKGAGPLVPGTLLDANHVQELKDAGISSVHISPSGLKVAPIVPGLQTAKLLDKNWVSRLSFSRLRDSLKESAATFASSDVHSTDPITSYMFGNEFGRGEDGKY
jgi:DNA-directed RNA polymerase subunit beta'